MIRKIDLVAPVLAAFSFGIAAFCLSDVAMRHSSGLGLVERIDIFIINAKAGCWPWSPRVVEFRQGMTLCPGQSTRVDGMITVPFPTKPPLPQWRFNLQPLPPGKDI